LYSSLNEQQSFVLVVEISLATVGQPQVQQDLGIHPFCQAKPKVPSAARY
jgi:hypothetical protein